jgi:hypothetical protein
MFEIKFLRSLKDFKCVSIWLLAECLCAFRESCRCLFYFVAERKFRTGISERSFFMCFRISFSGAWNSESQGKLMASESIHGDICAQVV